MKKLLLLFITLLMAGCASTSEKQARQDRADALTEAMIAAAKVPLVDITCPTQGCVMLSFKVGNPQALGQLADAVRVSNQPAMSETGQIMLAGIGMVTQLGTGAIIGDAVKGTIGRIVDGQTLTASAGFNANRGIASDGFSANGLIAGKIPQAPSSPITYTAGGDLIIGTGNNTSRVNQSWTNSYNRTATGGSPGTTGAGGTASNGP